MDLKTSMLLTSSFLKNRLSVNALKLFYTQLNDYLLQNLHTIYHIMLSKDAVCFANLRIVLASCVTKR